MMLLARLYLVNQGEHVTQRRFAPGQFRFPPAASVSEAARICAARRVSATYSSRDRAIRRACATADG
jgi:hypothetical protein